MQISEELINTEYLASLGVEARRLLSSGDFAALAERFGYALAYDLDPAVAIERDLARALNELQATALEASTNRAPRVRYFKPNDVVLVALVEVWVQTDICKNVLIELIVTGKESNRHVILEQISAAA